jgi:cell division protein FtsW
MRSEPVTGSGRDKGFAATLIGSDKILWMVFIAMCIVSFVEVFSASGSLAYKAGNYWAPTIRHGQMLMAGIFVAMCLQYIPYRVFAIGAWMVPAAIALLILTLFIGKEINGSKRWLSLLGLPPFQPSETAKFTCVIFISYCLSIRKQYGEARMFKYIVAVIFTMAALIVTENVSTAAYVIIFGYVLMFIGGISAKRMLSLTVVLAALGGLYVLSLFAMKDAWINRYDFLAKSKNRIEEFAKPKPNLDVATYVVTDVNRQATYSKIAIANGGIGKFPGLGQQRDTLPLAYADYIYAIIIEELGVVGGMIIMLMYIVLLFRVGKIAGKCDKLFPKYLVIGCGLMIGIQAFMNMAVVAGCLPVIGQPLPLISHGGTGTIITCAYFGIILSISRSVNKDNEALDAGDEPSPPDNELSATAPYPSADPLEPILKTNYETK